MMFKNILLKKGRGHLFNFLNIKLSKSPRHGDIYGLEYRQRDTPIDALGRCYSRQRYTPKESIIH